MVDTVVDAGAGQFQDHSRMWGPYWSDVDTGVIVFSTLSTENITSRRTTDGGATWTEEIVIGLGTNRPMACWYDKETPDEWRMPPRMVCWVYDLRIPGMAEETQDRVIRLLNESGIPARHAFKPMSRQPEYSGKYKHLNAHRLSSEVIYFPIDPADTREQVKRQIGALMSLL